MAFCSMARMSAALALAGGTTGGGSCLGGSALAMAATRRPSLSLARNGSTRAASVAFMAFTILSANFISIASLAVIQVSSSIIFSMSAALFPVLAA